SSKAQSRGRSVQRWRLGYHPAWKYPPQCFDHPGAHPQACLPTPGNKTDGPANYRGLSLEVISKLIDPSFGLAVRLLLQGLGRDRPFDSEEAHYLPQRSLVILGKVFVDDPQRLDLVAVEKHVPPLDFPQCDNDVFQNSVIVEPRPLSLFQMR